MGIRTSAGMAVEGDEAEPDAEWRRGGESKGEERLKGASWEMGHAIYPSMRI